MIWVTPIPYDDPAILFTSFALDPVAALLDGPGVGDQSQGEATHGITVLAVDPFQVVVAGAEGVTVDGVPVDGDPFSVLERELARFHLPPLPPSLSIPLPIRFRTGAIGFFGYELGRYLECLPTPLTDGVGMPEMVVGFYDVIAVFDHQTRQAWVVASGFPETETSTRATRAVVRTAALIQRLRPAVHDNDMSPIPGRDGGSARPYARPASEDGPAAPSASDLRPRTIWQPDMDAATYRNRVARILEYIRAGDIFQANFTQRFRINRPAELTAFALYQQVRACCPAPFSAFLACGEGVHLASASPERFVTLDRDGRVQTCPIKGTRPRGATPDEDQRLREALLASVKDRAENLMICDLLRNDLGRVCCLGSIQVPQLAVAHRFASVHHLVSVVEGQLLPGMGPIDLLRATFPGGSITGAPKIRAMEIIHELELARRGPYCGAIAWIGFDGAMDSSIVIRTLVMVGDRVVAQAGGGIVADSDPAAEYQEMLTKISPLLALLGRRPDEDDNENLA